MNNLAEIGETERRIRDIEHKLAYMLDRAAEIERGERRIEQRFGIFLDANYFNVKASELHRSLNLLKKQAQQ